MKQCPVCKSTFTDATLRYCMSDGVELIDLGGGQPNVSGQGTLATEETVVMPSVGGQNRATVRDEPWQASQQPADKPAKGGMGVLLKVLLGLVVLGILGVLVVAAGIFIYYNVRSPEKVSNSTNSTGSNSPSTSSASSSGTTAEKPTITGTQQAIIDGGTEVRWDVQGLSWKLPAGWKKLDTSKETFNYEGPDNAVLLVNISDLGDSFPMDISLKAYYDQAMQQLRSGKYESVKMVEIDGLPGVEFTEARPDGKDDARRHQWIGYRRYLGSVQQLNVMTSTRAANFDKHLDDFPAILYSMKAPK